MHALDIDVLREPSRPRWAMWLLLAVALGVAFDAAWHYGALQNEVATKRARVARVSVEVPPQEKRVDPLTIEEYKFARQTIARLALPWEELFRSLEAAKTDDLALIEIDPDPSNGSVVLSGEATGYLSVLTYVARLAEQPELRDVRLARHEVKSDQKAYLFSISASWQGGR